MKSLKLVDLIDIEILQKVQDAFSELTGMAALTTDEFGTPVTKGSSFTHFCMDLVRQSATGSARCEECDKNGAIMTMESGKQVVYTCHAGLVDFAAPIMAEGKMIGSFIGGQVRYEEISREKMAALAEEMDIDPEEYITAAEKTFLLPMERIENAASFLSQLADVLSHMAYVSNEALENSRKNENYAKYQARYYTKINALMQQKMAELITKSYESGVTEDPAELRKALQEIGNDGMNALSVVGRLISYMDLTGGQDKLNEDVYDVRQMVEQIAKENALSRSAGLYLEFDVSDNVPEKLYGDSTRLSYVITGLLGDCYTRMHEGSIQIRVRAVKETYATRLEITVKDNGAPVAEDLIRMMNEYAANGDVFQVDDQASEDHGFAMIGYLIFAMSGVIRMECNLKGENVVKVTVPQLAV